MNLLSNDWMYNSTTFGGNQILDIHHSFNKELSLTWSELQLLS